jgi:hypothetical protein
LEIIKYSYVRGFQFFISQQEGFTPTAESGEYTIAGTHSGVAGNILSDTASLTENTGDGYVGQTYYNVPFWDWMNLKDLTHTAKVTNITQDTSGEVTAWEGLLSPWNMTTDIAWVNGDSYQIKCITRDNLIHQGPLPFAVYLLRPDETWMKNKRWDGVSYYAKARTYGIGGPRSGRFSDFVCASVTSYDDWELTVPTLDTVNPLVDENAVELDWDDSLEFAETLSHYRVYRTTANSSNLLTDDTYLIADNVHMTTYKDSGYDAVTNPNGAEPCVTYYYWVRPVDIGGNIGPNSTPVTGHILIAADPSIYDGVEELDRGWGRRKAWVVYWTTAGSATGYFVRYRLKTNGGYGIWTVPVYIPHTTEFGQSGGEDIQSYTFHSLIAGRTYTFAVKATWNPMISGVSSNWVTQDYTINNTSVPAAPT